MAELGKKFLCHWRTTPASLLFLTCFVLSVASAEQGQHLHSKRSHEDVGKTKKQKITDRHDYGSPINPYSSVELETKTNDSSVDHFSDHFSTTSNAAIHRERIVKGRGGEISRMSKAKRMSSLSIAENKTPKNNDAKNTPETYDYPTMNLIEFYEHEDNVVTDEALGLAIQEKDSTTSSHVVVGRKYLRA